MLQASVRYAYGLADAGRCQQGALYLDLQLAFVELLPAQAWKGELVELYRLALMGYQVACGDGTGADAGLPSGPGPAAEAESPAPPES
ncbi:MAG TPA: hypothetical protein VFU47_01095 [Armatimonadota bacterium]|nr:hypothetical protein [Armatimonadota bacterium]